MAATLQHCKAAQLAWLSPTRTRSRSLASAVLRFRFAPPATSTGQGGDHALTINTDHSMGAGHFHPHAYASRSELAADRRPTFAKGAVMLRNCFWRDSIHADVIRHQIVYAVATNGLEACFNGQNAQRSKQTQLTTLCRKIPKHLELFSIEQWLGIGGRNAPN